MSNRTQTISVSKEGKKVSNKIWRKLVSLTLALALVIGMMPAIPGAVHVAHANTEIAEVYHGTDTDSRWEALL